jgi:3-methyl-2-oxobutanoate hydroxymethyltransferase
VRTSTLAEFKAAGKKFSCLTSYDSLTAGIFDEAGIDVLLVGDSAADNALGYSTTLPITVEEIVPFARAVAGAAKRSLVVVDLPFGSYETGVEDALRNSIRIIKVSGAAAVKLEGGADRVPQIEAIVSAGIPVMGHLGFTPQSVNTLGGFKVQGRGDKAEQLMQDALALEKAGAFAIVLELVPIDIAGEISAALTIPTIGIGAGPKTDAQILVWTDFAGLSGHKPRKFVKQYSQMRSMLAEAAASYKHEVENSIFPDETTSFAE